MKIEIEFFSVLQDLAKKKHHEVVLEKRSSKLLDLLNVISEDFGPQMGSAIFQSKEKGLHPGVIVAINGRNSNLAEGLDTLLKDGDKVVIGIAFRGG